jgi:hypothetical protein
MEKFTIVEEGNVQAGHGIITETEPGVFKVDLVCNHSPATFSGLNSKKEALERAVLHLYEVFTRTNGLSYKVLI